MTTPLKFEDAQRIVEETIFEETITPIALLREVAERLRAAATNCSLGAKQEPCKMRKADKQNLIEAVEGTGKFAKEGG